MLNFKKALLTYGLVDLISKGIGLITSPITTRLLTIAQYGAGPALYSIWSPFSFAQFGGMDWAYPYFKSKSQNENNEKILITNASIFAYFSVIIVWLIFFLLSISNSWLTSFAQVKRIELIFFISALLPSCLIYWLCFLLRYLNKVDSYFKISLLGRIMPAIVILPILPIFEQENRLIVSFGLGWLISCIAFLYSLYEIRRVGFWPFSLSQFNIKLSIKLFRYGILLVPAGAAYSMIVVTDRILIGFFLGPESVAIHAIAVSIASLGVMLVGWFGLAFDPLLIKWISSDKESLYLPKLQILAPALSTFFGLISCLSALWSDTIVSLIYPESYTTSSDLIPFLIYSSAIVSLSRIGVAAAYISQKPKYSTILYWLALIINIFLGFFLIQLIGIMGAVLSTIIAEFSILAGWIYLGRFHLKNLMLKWNKSLIILFISGLLVFGISIFLPNKINLLFLFSLSIIIIVTFLFLLFLSVGKVGFEKIQSYLY